MTPARWQEIDRLFHAALAYEPAHRSDFLAQACGGDEELRREVESLLSSHQDAKSFIETPAGDVAADLLDLNKHGFETGQQVNNYRIVRQLGSGGMGEVFLAQDIRLGRQVALKILPSQFTIDPQRVHRFEREARAASALNHPNIITIHEIGRFNSIYFIATEFVDGVTLREHLGSGGIALTQILNVGGQVASALAAAHEVGIVHRDIKPDNIMLRRDGFVKVLDFGLAKVAAIKMAVTGSQAPTKAMLQTDPGIVMGTAQYMSPEQTRAREVDARTDIWSLGVVLYEMTAGQVPFKGETPGDVISSILHKDPPRLVHLAPDVPVEFARIVEKALAKDREERYQTAKDLALDLKRLKQRLEVDAEIERSQTQGTDVTSAKGMTQGAQRSRPAAVATSHPTSSAEYLVGQINRHKVGVLIALTVLIVAMAGISFGVYKFIARRQVTAKSLAPLQEMKVRRLTSTGKAADAAISPDGRYVVHVLDEGGKQSLRLRQVETTSDVQILPPAEVLYSNLIFSRDGTYIYYIEWDKKRGLTTLYQLPALGGASRKLIENIDSTVTFSPNGNQFLFIRGDPVNGENALIVANADGSSERKVAARKEPASFDNWPYQRNAPAWSPDGQSIAAPASVGGSAPAETVIEVRVADGTMKQLSRQKWWRIDSVEWLRDGSGLIVNASEQQSKPFQIWHLSYPGGEARRITNDLNDYKGVSVTADSRHLVTVQSEVFSNIWIVPQNDASRARQISSGRFDGQQWVAVAPDGRIVYASRASGRFDLWITDADGNNQKQLTAHAGDNDHPAVTPDGRYVVFVSDRAGSKNLWRIDLDGSNPKQLTNDDAGWPDCSSDGQWVFYVSNGLWKVPIDGGQPVRLTDYWLPGGVVSPDGKWYASLWLRNNELPKMAIIPIEGGAPVKTLDMGWGWARWTPDGRALAYIDRRSLSNIISQPLDGGPPRQLTDFKSERIFSFAWSREGKQLALARGSVTNDVIVISDFQ